MRQKVRRWQAPILPRYGSSWLTTVCAGLGRAGGGRTRHDLDRLRQVLGGGVAGEVRPLRQRHHLGEDADVLLAEQRALPDPGLRLGIREAGDVIVVLALCAATESANE